MALDSVKDCSDELEAPTNGLKETEFKEVVRDTNDGRKKKEPTSVHQIGRENENRSQEHIVPNVLTSQRQKPATRKVECNDHSKQETCNQAPTCIKSR